MTDEVQPQRPLDDARERLVVAYDNAETARELIAAFEDFIQEAIKEAIERERARIVVEQGNTGIASHSWFNRNQGD